MLTPNHTGAPPKMRVQASKTKDRKEVGILTNYQVRAPTEDDTLLRRLRGFIERQPIMCPLALIDYNKWMGAVDQNDRDTSDWGIDLRTNR